MNFKKLKEFIDLAKSENVSELSYQDGDTKFNVSFQAKGQIISSQPQVAGVDKPKKSSNKVAATQGHAIKSPFVGTFYSSASPGKPNFVKVGDRVNSGKVLCILEAMKIMNEIESDVSGEIIEVCVENESLVEFGQVLFRVKV